MSQNVLIVDDEANIRKVLKALIEQQGYSAIEARDGIEALALLKKEDIHIIITDLRMPGQDGRAIFNFVDKSMPYLKKRVICATGDVLRSEYKDWLQDVNPPLLMKPFSDDDINSLLASLD